jgi:cation diffusion facilitator CzcD-associated flavoprotein CzcO
MHDFETDYLIVGGGATGMAFADALLAQSDAEVLIVDRRHRPGGHWLDAYPFVRLHQPSAYYGVSSRVLGNDRIDQAGPNAGFYERATAAEICDYFNRVLEEDLVPSGRLRFLPMCDYQGADTDGHHVTSLLTGRRSVVTVRRKLVDATYIESSIPSLRPPAYEIDSGVRLLAPNALVHLADPAPRFTVIGAGKTAMDTCNWLLDAGVDPDAIRWIRPRDGWFLNREYMQPLELVGSYMQLQARWVASAAACEDGTDFLHRLEADDVALRIDPKTEPGVFRGATISRLELDALRSIENVVRLGRVRRIATKRVLLDDGELAGEPDEVYVDCTAEGVRPVPARPVYAADRITMQWVTIGIAPWSAATIATVETVHDDDVHKNAVCPPVVFSGNAADILRLSYAGISGLTARSAEPDFAAWDGSCRLNPARGATDHMDDPRVVNAFTSLGEHIGPALENLERAVA